VVYGGRGRDTLTGGFGHDIFFFAEDRFATGDTVNGGAGYDGMFLRGNYTIDFNAPGYTGLFTNIENLTLTSATDERYARGGGTEFDYNLTLSDAIVNAGQTLTVSGSILVATETMVLDASQESDGMLRLFGGRASDTLRAAARTTSSTAISAPTRSRAVGGRMRSVTRASRSLTRDRWTISSTSLREPTRSSSTGSTPTRSPRATRRSAGSARARSPARPGSFESMSKAGPGSWKATWMATASPTSSSP
jgi:hypothetical protein